MTQSRGRILVIRGGAIGDFILTLPALTALRRHFPDARLDVLGYPHIAQLAVAGGLVDVLKPIEAGPLAGFFAAGGALAQDWADYFSEFDIILSYLYDPDSIFRDNVARVSRAQFIPGPHRPTEAMDRHATSVFLEPLSRLAIFDADPVPRLGLKHITPGGSQLALHPGSGGESKNWPEARWQELLKLLVERTDFPLLLIGGEAEGDRLKRLAAPFPLARVTLAYCLPLADLAVQLHAARAFVGHDSGISHLAAALGVPTLLLWGPSRPEIWQPLGKHVALLHQQSPQGSLPAERVLEGVLELAGRAN